MQIRQLITLFFVLIMPCAAGAQTTPQQLQKILSVPLESHDEVGFQLREYLMTRLAKLNGPPHASQWTAEENRLRKHLLDVVFHGWPADWVNSPPQFEDMGPIRVPAGAGYRMRKLRYEIVPGFWSTAILYVPEYIRGRVPAILNVNGHDYKVGKASEYKQKRCINFAKRGMVALSLEWLDCGELFHPGELRRGDPHWNAAYLDFVGANAVGLFYLAMRRGLDYVYDLPEVDRSRIGMTGLSGGGWQTITLSALDPRVAVAVPVAGYASLVTEIERPIVSDDIEQIPADFFVGVDNTHLTAMRAPRPTLLIYNDEDNCCYRAPLVKPYVYDEVLPIFKLYGKGDVFQWHDNQNPGTHNYQLDNRLHAYRFFSTYFHLPPITSEIPVGSEIKTYQELVVGLPKDNLTYLGLAKELAAKIRRSPIPQDSMAKAEWAGLERAKLKKIVRYSAVTVRHAWAVNGFKAKGIEVKSYRFEFNNALSATGVLISSLEGSAMRPVTIVLNDEGKSAAAANVSAAVNREERVLAANLIFTGDAAPLKVDEQVQSFTQWFATTGDRALGIETAQLIAIAHWVDQLPGSQKVWLKCIGIRSQIVGLIASALEPRVFGAIMVHQGVKSLNHVLTDPLPHSAAPDLFCLDLYKEFDVDDLIALAEPTEVSLQNSLDTQTK